MAAQRFSRVQKRLLTWLAADHHRTRGVTASSHQEVVQALSRDKSNISHSLQTLEARGSAGHRPLTRWPSPIRQADDGRAKKGPEIYRKV